jgi:hypothetical protein
VIVRTLSEMNAVVWNPFSLSSVITAVKWQCVTRSQEHFPWEFWGAEWPDDMGPVLALGPECQVWPVLPYNGGVGWDAAGAGSKSSAPCSSRHRPQSHPGRLRKAATH